mmetsp:Transcript_6748/g.30756  ORF Transcript_6748/g.30756 Transcript_6748/m.30756 type:complete len:124 (-) Transcript_6748:149-520(-)
MPARSGGNLTSPLSMPGQELVRTQMSRDPSSQPIGEGVGSAVVTFVEFVEFVELAGAAVGEGVGSAVVTFVEFVEFVELAGAAVGAYVVSAAPSAIPGMMSGMMSGMTGRNAGLIEVVASGAR